MYICITPLKESTVQSFAKVIKVLIVIYKYFDRGHLKCILK